MANDFGQRLHWYNEKKEISDKWRVFRKYDGHSAIWIPATRDDERGISGLWSLGRSNKPKSIAVPRVWLNRLPHDIALHGELWHPSDRPQEISKALTKVPTIDKWAQLKFIPFAFPSNKVFNPDDVNTFHYIENDEIWEDEREGIEDWIREMSVEERKHHIMLPEEIELEYVDLDNIEPSWEGLVFQKVTAKYRNGRSHDVLKFKPEYEDEAIVIGYEKGKTGARVGTTGAITVKWTMKEKHLNIHGAKSEYLGETFAFSVSGLNEEEWNDAEFYYPIGSELHFKFLSFSNKGTPMHCSIYREEEE